jgi:hypothetical protein
MDETDLEIESPRKAKLHLKHIYTILNISGDQFANISTFYDRFHKLKTATAILYDSTGKELKRIKKNDMEDWSAEGSATLLTDTRIKFYHFSYHIYPYTVSYEEESDLDGYFILPQWLPQPSSKVSVEDCKLIVSLPADYPLHFKEFNLPAKGAISEKNGEKTIAWVLRDRKAAQPEVFSPSWIHLEPGVKLAPGEFEIQGYKGTMNSWADLGEFMDKLWDDRDILPEDAKTKIHELIKGVTDDHRKIELLYDFLQRNSHYVSIQLGIGGWQPFDAAYVYHNRYGDCKALCNYMVALLKEARISANSVLVKAGYNEPDIDTSFASSQFNHVIVVAYTGSDSIWLECTSQTINPGYLGSFTEDRYGLMLNKGRSQMVHTPKYGVEENRLGRTLKGIIDSLGNLTAVLQTRSMGMEQDALQGLIKRFTNKELLEQRQKSLGLSNCIILDINYQEAMSKIPVIDETIHLRAENFCTVSGNRLFIEPGVFLKKVTQIPVNHQPRMHEIELTGSSQEIDSVELQIPPGYTAEKMIPNRHIVTPFGSFTIHSSLDGGNISIVSSFRQNKGIYPADYFSRFEQFFNLVYRENNSELVLIKKEK